MACGCGGRADDHDVPWGHPPIELMLAAPVAELPASNPAGGNRFEPKMDGWRTAVVCTEERRPQLRSRNGKRLDAYLPDLRRAITQLPARTVLDAEAVAWNPRGYTDFAGLQRRLVAGRGLQLHAARFPAYLIVFDALIIDARDWRDRPLVERREALEQLLATSPDRLLLCPQTDDLAEAQAMAAEMQPLGAEGLVIKPAASRYRGGRARTRSPNRWTKWRLRHSAEAVVGGITGSRARPETLLLGRFDAENRLRVVGQTTRLSDGQAAEIAPLLQPPGIGRQRPTHPWPQPLPAGRLTRFGQRDALPYKQVEPDLVVEVSADTAFELGRWRHPPRYQRVRADLSPWSTPPHRWDIAD